MSANDKQSRAAVEQRNLIVPQMRDYDELGMRQEWVPHLMYFHPRNVALKSVSTDEYGIRKTFGAKTDSPTALLVGGSSVFGIGATSDLTTIPSLLNASTKYNWHNLGGRAFNSTQEIILVHLANVQKIEGPIIVMSGVNNLIRSLMPGSFSPMYGAFFQQGLYEHQMKNSGMGSRELSRMLFAQICAKFGLTKKTVTTAQSNSSKTESYASMLKVFERDCQYLQMLAKKNNTTASFVLQPFIPWINKSLTSQETQLFSLLDQEAESFSRVLLELEQFKERYSNDIRTICEKIGMRFSDLNSASELRQANWLFVDRAHFTDEGNDTVTKLLVRELSL
ncbi:hypothetical protein LBMAG16_09470 [Actinomycetes bacterium]|nr:hypothetical protein LBMAG16_09470 [Actinomycetes bacterium]